MVKKLKAKSNLGVYLSFLGIVLAVVAVTLFFTDFVSGIDGFKVAFGYKNEISGGSWSISLGEVKGSPLALIAFILICVSVGIGLLLAFINLKFAKFAMLGCALMMVVASVFLFTSNLNFAAVNEMSSNPDLASGAILAGSYSAASAVCYIGGAFLK